MEVVVRTAFYEKNGLFGLMGDLGVKLILHSLSCMRGTRK